MKAVLDLEPSVRIGFSTHVSTPTGSLALVTESLDELKLLARHKCPKLP